MMTRWTIVMFFLFFFVNVWATYDYTPKHKEAYDLIISMRFDEAIEVIQHIKKEDPSDILIYHIENYIDFISIFISEEESVFKLKEANKEIRLARLKKGNPDDPYYLFSQAELHLQWALTRIKFEEYFTAAREVNKAIGMLERNQERFPEFISNKKSLSILHAIAGTLPDKYRGVVSLVSNFSGSIDQGIKEINEVLEESGDDYFFKMEAVAIKGMIMLHLQNKKEDAWEYLSSSIISEEDNPMATFLLASTASQCGRNEEAIKILEARTRSPRFFPFYYLDLMLGSAKLARLDKDADIYLRSYIQNFQGQDYFKDAARKLAWHALAVKEDPILYQEYMNYCKKIGQTQIDEDKAAMREAKRQTPPHLDLLKARLLFDGGYLERALQVLEKVRTPDLDQEEQIEFSYRKARIFHSLVKTEQAIISYSTCMNSDSNSRLYFACNSALQLGIIYEGKGDALLAEKYFEKCLSMNPSEYKNSLHQKAKSGLNRLKN